MSDDDPLFRLMERMCRLGEQLPSEEEVLHDENARHRAIMLVAEMRKIDKEVGRWGSVNVSDELVELHREAQGPLGQVPLRLCIATLTHPWVGSGPWQRTLRTSCATPSGSPSGTGSCQNL